MSRYYRTGRQHKRRKSLKEKIGFYTAFSICLVAVALAVYSTYNTVSNQSVVKTLEQKATDSQMVAQPVTGVTVPEPRIDSVVTEPPKEATVPAVSEPSVTTPTAIGGEMDDAMQTLLSVDLNLTAPTKSGKILRPYSKDSVYFKTINVWKPHLGVDFACDLGDKVLAMVNGEVTKVRNDKMYGKTVEISSGAATVSYSGMGDVKVKKGDSVERGKQIGTAGAVPCEAGDPNHIHIGLRIDGKNADPLNFMGNE
ncbi:MAG: M23 family metallopeptidase [Ruminococcus sp.]|nr:M23 family metallopeptidase [Ruminococcus sp.]